MMKPRDLDMVLDPVCGPIIAAAAMSSRSMSVVGNALRPRRLAL
jgi:cation transport ATPase